jgi:hypothetical protein
MDMPPPTRSNTLALAMDDSYNIHQMDTPLPTRNGTPGPVTVGFIVSGDPQVVCASTLSCLDLTERLAGARRR